MNRETFRRLRCGFGLLLILCLLLSALPGFACAETEDAVAARLAEARLLVNQGRGLAAKELLESAQQEWSDLRLAKALYRLEMGQWKNTEQIVYRSDGSVNYRFCYEYSETGQRVRSLTLSPEGEVQSEEVFTFNGENLRVGGMICDGEGRQTARAEFDLNEAGDVVRSVRYTGDKAVSRYEYIYNEYGDAVRIIRRDGEGTEQSRTDYTFDDYGVFTSMTNTFPDGQSVCFEFDNSYELEKAGELLRIKSCHRQTGQLAAEYVFRYIPLQ